MIPQYSDGNTEAPEGGGELIAQDEVWNQAVRTPRPAPTSLPRGFGSHILAGAGSYPGPRGQLHRRAKKGKEGGTPAPALPPASSKGPGRGVRVRRPGSLWSHQPVREPCPGQSGGVPQRRHVCLCVRQSERDAGGCHRHTPPPADPSSTHAPQPLSLPAKPRHTCRRVPVNPRPPRPTAPRQGAGRHRGPRVSRQPQPWERGGAPRPFPLPSRQRRSRSRRRARGVGGSGAGGEVAPAPLCGAAGVRPPPPPQPRRRGRGAPRSPPGREGGNGRAPVTLRPLSPPEERGWGALGPGSPGSRRGSGRASERWKEREESGGQSEGWRGEGRLEPGRPGSQAPGPRGGQRSERGRGRGERGGSPETEGAASLLSRGIRSPRGERCSRWMSLGGEREERSELTWASELLGPEDPGEEEGGVRTPTSQLPPCGRAGRGPRRKRGKEKVFWGEGEGGEDPGA